MKRKTVLILGAGASHAYGFPLGSQLRTMILNLRDNESISNEMGFGLSTIRNFVDAFGHSQSNSIDLFLGRRQQFLDVGKAAIAYVLLQCEKKANLFSDQIEDHWYKYLLNALTTDAWESFDPSWLSIVTFNYERSLQHFLATAIQHTYGKSWNESIDRLRQIKIVPMYGTLTDPFTEFPFGQINDENAFDAVRLAAKQLSIVPEGRDDSPNVLAARELIGDAQKICMLGFGFDETNVRRLGAPTVFRMESAQKSLPKTFVATSVGLTFAERDKAINQVFDALPNHYLTDMQQRFHNKNCVSTLRETLILD